MYRWTNIPNATNKRAQLTPTVDGNYAKVVVIDPDIAPPFNATGVGDLYIGDHMFEPPMRDDLRMMVAKTLVSAIEAARDAGYQQAKHDIRTALGIHL